MFLYVRSNAKQKFHRRTERGKYTMNIKKKKKKKKKKNTANRNRQIHTSPAQNKFDLELWYKVFFFTDSCRLDIAITDSG